MAQLIVLGVFTVLLGVVTANPTSRIVNGNNANFTQFAHQISLRIYHRHTCGGSIISQRHILTAAHCVVDSDWKPRPPNNYTIRAGTINRIAGGVLVQVKSIKVHPDTDIALLELEENLTFSDHIQAIDLFAEEVPEKSQVLISGWGKTDHFGAGTPIFLQYLHVTAISISTCDKELEADTESLICLKNENSAGACFGDSGGPATYNGKLVGVASFIVEKCGSLYPDGYAKVAYNIDWIRKNMA